MPSIFSIHYTRIQQEYHAQPITIKLKWSHFVPLYFVRHHIEEGLLYTKRKRDTYTWDIHLLRTAIDLDNLACVKVLYRNDCPELIEGLNYAASNNKERIVRWILNSFPTFITFTVIRLFAFKFGHTDILFHYLTRLPVYLTTQTMYYYLYYTLGKIDTPICPNVMTFIQSYFQTNDVPLDYATVNTLVQLDDPVYLMMCLPIIPIHTLQTILLQRKKYDLFQELFLSKGLPINYTALLQHAVEEDHIEYLHLSASKHTTQEDFDAATFALRYCIYYGKIEYVTILLTEYHFSLSIELCELVVAMANKYPKVLTYFIKQHYQQNEKRIQEELRGKCTQIQLDVTDPDVLSFVDGCNLLGLTDIKRTIHKYRIDYLFATHDAIIDDIKRYIIVDYLK